MTFSSPVKVFFPCKIKTNLKDAYIRILKKTKNNKTLEGNTAIKQSYN